MSAGTSSNTGRRLKTLKMVQSHAGPGTSSYRIESVCNACDPRLLCHGLHGSLEGWQRPARGLLFLLSECPVGLHEGMNIARALVDDRSLAIAQVALDGIVV